MCRLLFFLFYFYTIQRFPFFFFFFFPIWSVSSSLELVAIFTFFCEPPFFCYKQCLHWKVCQPQLYQFYPRLVFFIYPYPRLYYVHHTHWILSCWWPFVFCCKHLHCNVLEPQLSQFFHGSLSSVLYMRINLFYRIGFDPQLPMGNWHGVVWCDMRK